MNIKLQRALPIILAIASSIGVAATTILAVKSTPKAEKVINELKEKGELKDQKIEVAKKVIPIYAPALAVGMATITSVVASTVISKKTEASLSAAALLLEQGYKKYQGKVKDVLGMDKHYKVIEEIAKDDANKVKPFNNDPKKKLYWNKYLGFFLAEPENLQKAFSNMNMRLNATNAACLFKQEECGCCTLSQLVSESHMQLLEKYKYDSYKYFGWTTEYLNEEMSDPWIYIGEKPATDDHGAYTIIEFVTADPICNPADYDFSRLMELDGIESQLLESDYLDKQVEEHNND